MLKRLFSSRKFLIALSGVVAAVVLQLGFDVNESVIYTILGTGVALITGIAVEDSAEKLGNAGDKL